jgi:hypothetical protein
MFSTQILCAVGKLPASQANGEVVAAHRREEWAQKMKLLECYVSICFTEKVILYLSMLFAILVTDFMQFPCGRLLYQNNLYIVCVPSTNFYRYFFFPLHFFAVLPYEFTHTSF